MSWQDRDYPNPDDGRSFLGRPGGDWQGLRPTFDNPLSWSVFIMRIAGIDVRIHVFFLLFIVIELLRAALRYPGQQQTVSLAFTLVAITMGALFVIVLAHEFGHCLACRWMKGQANEILMWPLGGLAFCRPPNRWQAHLVTAIGGPLVNVVLCVAAGLILGLLTGRWLGVALPNPLDPFGAMYDPKVMQSLAHQTLYLVNSMSMVLLLFNLLPIFPLDGGRIVQSALWPNVGYVNSMRIAVRTGYVGAILLFIYGVVAAQYMVAGIAIFGGFTCWYTLKQLEFTEQFMGFEDDELMLGAVEDPAGSATSRKREERQRKQAEREARQEADAAAEIDRILQKIADSGLESLSTRERKLLKTETERKRRNGPE